MATERSTGPDDDGNRPDDADSALPQAPRRHRTGRPPRINRQMIVDAARELDAETLTLQAVADRLGVARKAINYYVSGRDELLALVADQAIAEGLGNLEIPQDDWRQAIRAYATGVRNALLEESSLAIAVTTIAGAGVLAPADDLLRALLAGGFDRVTAGRALEVVNNLVFIGARNAILIRRFGEHPSSPEVRRVLADAPADQLTALRETFGDGYHPDEQPEFGIDLVIAGLERLLAT